jgi:hypothetical protein
MGGRVLWGSDTFLLTLRVNGKFIYTFYIDLKVENAYNYYSDCLFNENKRYQPSNLPECIGNYFERIKYYYGINWTIDDDHWIAINTYHNKFRNESNYHTHIVTCNIVKK